MIVCACMMITTAFAQGKAKVYIKKNVSGVTSEETHEVNIAEGEDIQKVLQELGVLDEFGQLKPGQEFEIKIDKFDVDSNIENLHFFFTPDAPMPPMPPLPPLPPTMETRPFLGVMLRETIDMNTEKEITTGAYVTEVIEGTAAETAGILAGDVIVEIDKLEMAGMNDVIEYVQSKNPNDKIEVRVLRDGKKKKINVELGEKEMEATYLRGPEGFDGMEDLQRLDEMELFRNFNFRFDADSITIFCPSSPNCICPNDSMKICQPFTWNGEGMAIQETAFLGVTPMDNDSASEGVKVNVEEQTSAEEMGLMDGDIITEFNGVKVTSFDLLSDEISNTTPESTVNMTILRDGKQKTITGEIGKRSMSGYEDFRIFHDFKGMDEGGNYFYDYEFDMDAGDVEQHMEELLRTLDEQQLMLDDERARLLEEMARIDSERETILIKIRIEEITQEELEAVNQTASPKLSIENDLAIEEISFFPNPGVGVINLSFSTSDKSDVSVVVFDASGNKVYTEEKKDFAGEYKNIIDISTQPNGTYYLQIMQGEKSYSKKMVKGL